MKIIANLILTLLLTFGCGFKIVDKSNVNNFKIKEINTTGNSRIGYKIKNYLIVNTQEINNNAITIDIKTKTIKDVKEKNIKNEITKYQITLEANIKTYLIEKNKKKNYSLTVYGDYLVETNYSGTINNEKALINTLTEELSKKILRRIGKSINDI